LWKPFGAPYSHPDRRRTGLCLAGRGGRLQNRRDRRSNTYGWGVGSQNAYPAQLQALLRGKGLHANVINAGVLGDTTAGMLRRLDTAVPKGTNIVILQPGGDDLRFGFSKEQRAANIGAMVTRLRA
jgi:acyl-CoA thioesterase I